VFASRAGGPGAKIVARPSIAGTRHALTSVSSATVHGLDHPAVRLSILDGVLSMVMGALAGGVFLVGFALKVLHATPQQIGIVAALTPFAGCVQLLGSYVIERTGRTKLLCVGALSIGRLLWIVIILLPLPWLSSLGERRIWVLIAILAVVSLLSSLGGGAWLAWTSDLISPGIRGRFFARRMTWVSATGLVTTLTAGWFLTRWERHYSVADPVGFVILFAIGVVAGLLSAAALWSIPEPPHAQQQVGEFRIATFLAPFRDRNFAWLVIFVAGWLFSSQLSAPFYTVLMIDRLGIDFSTVTVLTTVSTLASVGMMKIWGPIADRLGNKPVILVCGTVLAFVPALWTMAAPERYFPPLLAAHALSGAFTAGVTLSQTNILVKLAPRARRSVFLAVFAATTGVIGSFGPLLGGRLAGTLGKQTLTVGGLWLTNLHALFALTSALQIALLVFFGRIHETGAAKSMTVVMQLRNDLDPQTGIGSAMDVIMLEGRRAGGVLRRLDRWTDGWADRSEARIARILDGAGANLKRLRRRVRRRNRFHR
jgi:MFS family permease